MPVGFPATANNVTVTTTSATTILSGIATAFVDADQPNNLSANVIGAAGIRATITGTMNVTVGAAATSVAIKCFNNAGTQIGATRNVSVTAGATQEIDFFFTDTTPSANNTYSVQVQFTAATGNSTVNQVLAQSSTPG